jgi:hypothetical protein
MDVGVSFQRAAKSCLIPSNGPSALSSGPKGRLALKFYPAQPARGGQAPRDGRLRGGSLPCLHQTPDHGLRGVRQALKNLARHC